MKSQIGLWIDHREAVIVTLKDNMSKIQRVQSEAGELDTETETSLLQPQRRKKHFDASLSKFYGKLITIIHDASSMLIFGPGEAKYEFEKKLQRRGLDNHVVAIETTENMTEAQVLVKVQDYFTVSE